MSGATHPALGDVGGYREGSREAGVTLQFLARLAALEVGMCFVLTRLCWLLPGEQVSDALLSSGVSAA